MEKAVVRRGIGAVVLALVAALLLGYLLKGKGPARQEVVKMELPKTPIQIFPEGQSGSSVAQNQAGKSGSASTAATGAGATIVDGAGKVAKAGADAGKKLAGAAADAGKKHVVGNLVVDKKTGNPHMDKKNVVIDGAGQAVYGTKSAGVKDTPANFAFRTPSSKEVRPTVDGKITLNKGNAKGKKVVAKSNARLVNEKKLPPVGKSSRKSVKVASSRNAKKSSKGNKKVVKAAPARKKAAAPAGRNKYTVQLLATSSSSKATALKNTLKREGYAAYVSTTKRGGKSLYRVRVGGYTGRSAALRKQAAMKRRYLKNPYVQSSVVVKN